MKNSNRMFILCICAVAALLSVGGCAGMGDLFRNPTARIESVEITGLDFNGISLLVNVAVENPNPLGITLSAYDYGLMISDETVVSGRREEAVSLNASGSSLIPVPVDISYQQLAGAASVLKHEDMIPLSVTLGLEIAIPYMGGIRLDLSGSVEVPSLRPPMVRPSGIRVESINLTGADILLTVNMENPNGFALTIQNAEGFLTVGGNEWGRISSEEGTWIPAKKTTIMNFRTRVDFVQVGRSAWSLLTGSGNAQVAVDGTMDVDMDLPAFNGGGVKWDGDAKVSIIR